METWRLIFLEKGDSYMSISLGIMMWGLMTIVLSIIAYMRGKEWLWFAIYLGLTIIVWGLYLAANTAF